MPVDPSTILGSFFEFQFGTDKKGQVHLATIQGGVEFAEAMMDWPRQKNDIVQLILAKTAEGKDVYYAPSLFVEKKDTITFNKRGQTAGTKENILSSQLAWVDFDGEAPDNWEALAKEKGIPEPSLIVESSVQGRQHAYWRLDDWYPLEQIEDRNRAIALAVGADRSGWDATQLLRPPFTLNYGYLTGGRGMKPWFKGKPVESRISATPNQERVAGTAFNNLTSGEREIVNKLTSIESTDIPTIEEVLAFGNWSKALFDQFGMNKEEASASSHDKRSGALQKLMYDAAESGMSDAQMFAIIDYADKRWEKYVNRMPGNRHKILLDTIAKARAKVGYASENDLVFSGFYPDANETTEASTKLVYNFQEVVEADIQIEWLLESAIPTQGLGVITGQPGVGKTQLAIQMAASFALGKEILGWQNRVGEQKVLFMSLEMELMALKLLMTNMAPMYEPVMRKLAKNLDFYAVNTWLSLDKAPAVAFFENLLREYKPDVVVVDSLSRVVSGTLSDETTAKELMHQLNKLRRTYQCSFIFVHHDKKRGRDQNGPAILSDMLGFQTISANFDWAISLSKTEERGILTLDNIKSRFAVERDPFKISRNKYVQFDVAGESYDADKSERGIRLIGGTESPLLPGDVQSSSPFFGGS